MPNRQPKINVWHFNKACTVQIGLAEWHKPDRVCCIHYFLWLEFKPYTTWEGMNYAFDRLQCLTGEEFYKGEGVRNPFSKDFLCLVLYSSKHSVCSPAGGFQKFVYRSRIWLILVFRWTLHSSILCAARLCWGDCKWILVCKGACREIYLHAYWCLLVLYITGMALKRLLQCPHKWCYICARRSAGESFVLLRVCLWAIKQNSKIHDTHVQIAPGNKIC